MRTIVKTTRKTKRTIAVPTDFFPRSTFAMTYALALAQTDKSRVVAVHAVDPFEYSFGPDDVRSLKKQEVWARAHEAMSRWLKANKFLNCATKLIEGEAGPAIAQFIDQEGINLTVLGTSARSHTARLLLGSVAEEIFRKANGIVLVLGPRMRSKRRQLEQLLFATDLEAHSLAALSRVSGLARKFDSTVSVIRVIHPDIRSRTERSRIERETKLKIEAASDSNLRKRIKEIQVKFGHPVRVILAAASLRKTDAIVMGIRSGGGWDRATTHIPWALAHRVIANARCPVLTIQG